MTAEEQGNGSLTQAAQWREAFDQSFARAPSDAAVELQDYLAIRVGSGGNSGGYVLRLAEVGGLQLLSGLTPCPSRHAELLGLSTFRGNVLPVYDLRVLLGAGAGAEELPAWWVAVKDAPLGLAFDRFERHLRLPADAIGRAGATDGVSAQLYTAQTLRCEGQLWPIVSIDSILSRIKEMVQQDGH